MSFKADIGIIGAMDDEVREIISRLQDKKTEMISGIEFNLGELFGKKVVIAKCGVGKVFAAICAEAMIIKYAPDLVVNTGVGGALDKSLRPLDIVFADRVLQYDMDTSPIGDPVGLISGINIVKIPASSELSDKVKKAAEELGINCVKGVIASLVLRTGS